MANIKYAYVSYVGTNERDIVPIENIKNFSIDKHDGRTKYKIKWHNNWYYGSIAFYGESEEEVREKAERSRPKIVSDNLLISNSESEEPERSNKRNIEEEEESNSKQEALLQKKLKLLTNKQSTIDEVTEPVHSQSTINEETLWNTPTAIGRNSTPRATTSRNDIEIISANVPITTIGKNKEVVSTKKQLFVRTSNNEVLKLKLENKKLESENKKLESENKDLQQQLKDSQILNFELQKKVINVVGDMQVQLSRLINKPILKEDEHLGYPPVAFVKNSDNSIHIGQDVWLKGEIYDTIVFTSSTPSLFVKQMATAVFGGRTLTNSSVTGRVSNRRINKADCPPPRPKLDPTKLKAIEDIYRHWLQNTKNYNSVQVNAFIAKMPSYITKKISQLNVIKKVVCNTEEESEGDESDVAHTSNHELDDITAINEINMAAAAASPSGSDDDIGD